MARVAMRFNAMMMGWTFVGSFDGENNRGRPYSMSSDELGVRSTSPTLAQRRHDRNGGRACHLWF